MRPLSLLNCLYCGGTFQARRDAKTCSKACRQKLSRRKRDPRVGTPERRADRLAGLDSKYAHRQRGQTRSDLQKLGLVPSDWERDSHTGKNEPNFDTTPYEYSEKKGEPVYWQISDGHPTNDYWRFNHESASASSREQDRAKSKTAKELAAQRRKATKEANKLTPKELPPSDPDERLEAACNNRERKYGSYERLGRTTKGRGVYGRLEEAGRLWRLVYVDGGPKGNAWPLTARNPDGHMVATAPRRSAFQAYRGKRSKDQFPTKTKRIRPSKVRVSWLPESERVEARLPMTRDQHETMVSRKMWEGSDMSTAELIEIKDELRHQSSQLEEIIGIMVSLQGHPADEAEKILEEEENAA